MNNNMRYPSKKPLKWTDILICAMYVSMFFFEIISAHIPFGNYLDELIALVAFGWMISNKKKIILNSLDFKIIILCFGIIFIGVFCNLIFGYVTSVNIIIRDIIGTFKFFWAFIAFDYIFRRRQHQVSQEIILIAKILITIIFVYGIISLYVNIGMGDIVRYGIRSYKFIFSFYNILVFGEVILCATLMCDGKRNVIFYFMSFVSILLTLRTKGIIVIILTLAFKTLGSKKNNPILYGNKTKNLIYIIVAAVAILFAVQRKVREYLSWGIYSSIRIGALVEGWNILKDHFGLGVGFGTYGTNLSFKTESVIYSIYNRINYELMMDPQYGFATMSDTYWPSIYVQFGIVGFMLFLHCLYLCFKKLRNNKSVPAKNRQAGIFILFYLIIASFSEAIFSNDSGLVSSVVIAMILNMSGKVEPVTATHINEEAMV